jgi:hypothetical protein
MQVKKKHKSVILHPSVTKHWLEPKITECRGRGETATKKGVGKVKVKLSLCLIKHHTIKTYGRVEV